MRKIYKLDKETEAKLQQGLADIKAGRVRPAREFFAELEERYHRDNLRRNYNYSGRS